MALVIGALVFSLAVIVLTWGALEALASRRAAFWHVAEVPRIGPPAGPASQRPMESPDVRLSIDFEHPHFMYLDRRPQRERLLSTYLAPAEAREVPSGAVMVWSGASALLAVGAIPAFVMASDALSGVVMVILAALFATTATRGLVQNARLHPRIPVSAQLAERASSALARAQQLTEQGESAGARILLEDTADYLHDLAPGSGDSMQILSLAEDLRTTARGLTRRPMSTAGDSGHTAAEAAVPIPEAGGQER
jgi:hypothetical protein